MAKVSKLQESLSDELLLVVFEQLAYADRSALMRTCKALHQKLVPEAYKDLPVLGLGHFTDGQMSIEYIRTYGDQARNLVLYYDSNRVLQTREKVYEEALRQLLQAFENHKRLENVGFSPSTKLSPIAYGYVINFLRTDIFPRILSLPPFETGSTWNEKGTISPCDVMLRAHRLRGSSTRQQDHLEIFLSKAGSIEAASTALNKDYHVVKEVAFYWDAAWREVRPGTAWGYLCRKLELKVAEVPSLRFYAFDTRFLKNVKLTDAVRAIAFLHNDRSNGLGYSTTDVLKQLVNAHKNGSGPKMQRIKYIQIIRILEQECLDHIRSTDLKSFLESSDQWIEQCLHQEQEYEGGIDDFACSTLKFGSYRCGYKEPTSQELASFAKTAVSLRGLGFNRSIFSRYLEDPDMAEEFDKDMEVITGSLRSLKHLEALCIFTPALTTLMPDNEKNEMILNAVQILATKLVRNDVPLQHIFITSRNTNYGYLAWRRYPQDPMSFQIFKSSTGVEVTRIFNLDEATLKTLDTLGGGGLPKMKQQEQRALGHLYATKQEMITLQRRRRNRQQELADARRKTEEIKTKELILAAAPESKREALETEKFKEEKLNEGQDTRSPGEKRACDADPARAAKVVKLSSASNVA